MWCDLICLDGVRKDIVKLKLKYMQQTEELMNHIAFHWNTLIPFTIKYKKADGHSRLQQSVKLNFFMPKQAQYFNKINKESIQQIYRAEFRKVRTNFMYLRFLLYLKTSLFNFTYRRFTHLITISV